MRVKKISAFVLAMVLCLSPFTLFSFAADILSVKDSGSPEVSLMALRSIAADDGISLAAAEGNSGQFGYNIEPFDDYYHSDIVQFDWGLQYQFYYYFPAGDYLFSFSSDKRIDVVGLNKVDPHISVESAYANSSTYQFNFSISEPSLYYLLFNFRTSDLPVSFVNLQGSSLIPVEGISSGYTYSSGIIPKTTRSIFETLTPSFGNQPAGKYLVNIYHWGDSYDVKFHISDSSESYYLPTSTNGGVTTLVYNHPGGDFTLDGSFTASNVETSVVDGNIYGSGFSGSGANNGSYVGGEIEADGPLSWVFNITDIVAIPYEQASDSNFGFFAPIIGFFRDHFSDMKSWIAIQIDKIAGDVETKTDVDDAQSELQKEFEDLNNLSGQLDTQASNLEQQFTTDFAIPDSVSGQGSNFQSIYTSLFGSLGVFGIFIWLPIVMAVIKKLLRL